MKSCTVNEGEHLQNAIPTQRLVRLWAIVLLDPTVGLFVVRKSCLQMSWDTMCKVIVLPSSEIDNTPSSHFWVLKLTVQIGYTKNKIPKEINVFLVF